MNGKSKLLVFLYSGIFAIVGGMATFQVVAFDGDLTLLVVLWWLALPMTPVLFAATVFLGVFLAYAWGNDTVFVVVPVLCALLFFLAGLIQATALRGIVRYCRRRKSMPNDV
jgi:hypothetical protein